MGASSGTRRRARARGLVPLLGFAAAMAAGRRRRAALALALARRLGATRREAEETALMLVLHAGFPAALEALALLDDGWPGRARSTPEGSRSRWRRDGEQLCRRVYGEAYSRLVANVARLHPVMPAWMIEEGYGRVLSRPGLGHEARELVAVAVLAAGGWERQLVSHLLGARRLGGDRRAIERAVAIGVRGASARRRAAAARAMRRAYQAE
jgi:4-carboxymuconolactone decarboxylase